MKKWFYAHTYWILLVLVLNALVAADFLFHSTKMAVLDGNAHITTMAQFHNALTSHEFPVLWTDGFANYGLPLGTIAHQIPNYLGGMLIFVTGSPLIAFYLITAGVLLASGVLFYVATSKVVSPRAAFVGTVLYSLSAYRITNVYVRGALPELFTTLWLPILFLLFRSLAKKEVWNKWLAVCIVLWFLILTHPMAPVIYAPAIVVMAWYFFGWKRTCWARLLLCGLMAALLSAYYLLPLQYEKKFLYMGTSHNLLVNNQAVTIDSLTQTSWRYACPEKGWIIWRCPQIIVGVMESLVFIVSLGIMILLLLSKRFSQFRLILKGTLHKPEYTRALLFAVIGSATCLFLSSELARPLYEQISLLGNIQIPSRFLSPFYFFIAFTLAVLIDTVTNKLVQGALFLTVISVLVFGRFPQLYGKNYLEHPNEFFYFGIENYHGIGLQPIWSEESTDYPIRRDKATIESGSGRIESRVLKNASREYVVHADTELLISDNTFYFPGWNVYINGQKTDIQFQDPHYRGVITFTVPPGRHIVRVVYEDTKVRRVGKLITLASIAALMVGVGVRAAYERRRKQRFISEATL